MQRPPSEPRGEGTKSIVAEVLETVLMIYEYFGFNAKGFSLERSIRIHESMSRGMNFMKYWKFRFAAFFSAHKSQILPKCIIPKQNLDDLLIEDFSTHASKLLYGRGDRFVLSLVRENKDAVLPSFLQSILMLKKGLRRPEDSDVVKGLRETFEMLTRENKITDEVSSLKVFELDTFQLDGDGTLKKDKKGGIRIGRLFQTNIREVVKEVFQHSNIDNLLSTVSGIAPRIPSTNANYVTGQRAAGTLGLLQDMFHNMKLFKDEPGFQFLKHEFDNFRLRWGDSVQSVTRHIFRTSDGEERIESEDVLPELALPVEMITDLERIAEDFSYFLRRQALREDSSVELVGLKEALKVRVISKGPPLTYYSLKPMQKFLHGEMRKHKAFRFIGETVSANAMQEILGDLKENQYFVSGDYKDATNNMHPLLSRLAVNAICDELELDRFDTSLRTLMLKALVGHYILHPTRNIIERFEKELAGKAREHVLKDLRSQLEIYYDQYTEQHAPTSRLAFSSYVEAARSRNVDPDRFLIESLEYYSQEVDGADEDGLRQQLNGQLMGSPMSFIILCIVNASLLKSVDYLNTGRKKKLSDIPVTVNGDDFVYKTTQRGYRIWQTLTPFTGMEESVGKTFCSREFCNMNSREFLYRNGKYSMVPFINLGLVYGMKRSEVDLVASGTDRGLHDEGSLAHRVYEALETAPVYCRARLYDFILNKNSDILRSVRLPWFVPAEYGGVGLPMLTRWGSLYNWRQLGLPSSCEVFRKRFEEVDDNVKIAQWSDVFHTFGKTVTYPTYRNLSALRNLFKLREDGTFLMNEVTPVTSPVIFNMHKVVSKALPAPTLVSYQTHLSRSIERADTPNLQFIYFLYSLFVTPIDLEYDDDKIANRAVRLLNLIEKGKVKRSVESIDELLSAARQSDLNFFKLEDDPLFDMHRLLHANSYRSLMAYRSIAINEKVWQDATKNFSHPFNNFVPQFFSNSYSSLNL